MAWLDIDPYGLTVDNNLTNEVAAGDSAANTATPTEWSFGEDLDAPLYVPPLPGRFVDVADAQVFVRESGDRQASAESAVFIHGLGGSSTNWTELMALLAPHVHCVAVDLPGFGQSPPPMHGDYKLSAHADITAAVIRGELGDRPVHIFGNSMGGATAVQLAARYPELVRSMTLISPALPELRPRRSNIHMPLTAIPGLGEKLMERVLRNDVEWRVKMSTEICYSDPSTLDPRRMADQIAEARERDEYPHTAEASLASLRGLLATYFDYSHQSPWKLARKIAAPTLLIYGRDDKLVNPRAAFRSSRAFPNARIMVMPRTGHVAQMEHPRWVAQAWFELIESGSVASGATSPSRVRE